MVELWGPKDSLGHREGLCHRGAGTWGDFSWCRFLWVSSFGALPKSASDSIPVPLAGNDKDNQSAERGHKAHASDSGQTPNNALQDGGSQSSCTGHFSCFPATPHLLLSLGDLLLL